MEKFKGIITALATPFDSEGKINESALEQLIEYNIGMGVSGFFVCGSSAEVFYLSTEERKIIMELTQKYTKGRVTLIAHVGAISTAETISLAKYAEELGYDAVSSVAPFYHKLKFSEIEKYFNDITKAVNIPLIIYNIPILTNVHFTANELCSILKNDKIIGVKHTSNDYYQLRQLKTKYPQKIIYNGFDETFMAGLVMGADGAIGSNFNFMADKFVEIYNLFNENKISEAMKTQENATKIITVIYKYGLSQSIKAILKHKGIDCGVCRAPLGTLSEVDEKNLLSELSTLL